MKDEKEAFTEDSLLGGRVLIRQPSQGYRVAIDPVFLAASIQADTNDTVLDIGCGIGAASLCLAARVPQIKIIGVELQRAYMRYAADNIQLNNMRDRIEILHGDLLRPPPRLAAGTFAHVMANPPYFEPGRNNISPNEQKASANHEGEAILEQWAKFCLLMVRPKGSVTFIYRTDKLDHLISFFVGKLGNMTIYPLWPGKDKPAKRVLIRGTKNTAGSLRLLPGMTLHNDKGDYTQEADNILRYGQAIHM